MVAKIGRGTSLFGALIYNQNKVVEGTARVISSHRMVGDVENIAENAMQQMMFSFEPYLAANKRTEKPILHISLNPSLADYLTDAQFAQFAADYLEQMGYGDQPHVVFMHEDTGRRHIHIVTTCVDENGRKISSAYEWKRSMTACRDLEQKYGLVNSADPNLWQALPYIKKVDHTQGDLKHQISNTLKNVVAGYKFQSFGEFSALLSSYNIEARQMRGEHNDKPWVGIVYSAMDENSVPVEPPFKSSLFGKQFGQNALAKQMRRHVQAFRQNKWAPKIQDTVRLAMITSRGDRARFEKTMRDKGIDTIFRTNEQGRVYGVTFIDHNAREVYNGSRLGKEFSANAFERLFNAPAPTEKHSQSEDIPDLFETTGAPEPLLEDEDEALKQKIKKKKRYISR